MEYLRFLTDKDYLVIATGEHMNQLIRNEHDRFPQAERRAEMQILEYLDQYYEIEKILAVGKNIREFNPCVTYPANVLIKVDGDICKTLRCINGQKKPTKLQYWKHVVDFIDPRKIDCAIKYSQLRMYTLNEVVRFGTEYWQCMIPHGYNAGEIHVPGMEAWRETEVIPWEPNLEWKKDQVCSFEGQFYTYLKGADEGNNEFDEAEEIIDGEATEEDGEGITEAPGDEVITPAEDDNWGLIGDYSEELEYVFAEDTRDYVVAEDTVFYPVINPNADKLIMNENIMLDDPRNANIVAHMSRIALYHLHSIISPTNISETRRWAYEDSMQWLYNASKFKINPQLPRKRDRESGQPKVDWACATYQRDFNPNENAWLI